MMVYDSLLCLWTLFIVEFVTDVLNTLAICSLLNL